MANKRPALFPKLAIPGTTKPNISKGITKLKNVPKRDLKVTNTLVKTSGKNKPKTVPNAIAISIFGNRPIFFIFICFSFLKSKDKAINSYMQKITTLSFPKVVIYY